MTYSLGLDYGSNSLRALLVDLADGREVASAVWNYAQGQDGILLSPSDPNLARQHPKDYLLGLELTIRQVLAQAAKLEPGFQPDQVIGLGVDTTGSTPLPMDADGVALGLKPEFDQELAALAWLWKDHTAHAEAQEITDLAAQMHPEYLAACGGRYSSEWFWAKLLKCARSAPKVFAASATWIELADWIPAVLTATTPAAKRGICAAGHKAFFSPSWGGYPAENFLSKLSPELVRIRRSLPSKAHTVAESAGTLCPAWAQKLGLSAGIPVAIGAFDAHLGAVGAGIGPGTIVKIMGTSTCDLLISPLAQNPGAIPGLCGIVPESVLPGYWGLEAGQSAVGDIFNWCVKASGSTHEALTAGAAALEPGRSGLLALDWHNGNRTVLVDQRLSGLILGLHLQSTPAEIYRALIEATAFGARVIIDRVEAYKVPVERVLICGGISNRNPLVMQIYANVLNRPLLISRSTQTCALGSAMAAAVVAGEAKGGYGNFPAAMKAMAHLQEARYLPNPAAAEVYQRLYGLYRQLHDGFGLPGQASFGNVMKELLAIRDR